jgi:small-conductance mechanosensitive channel
MATLGAIGVLSLLAPLLYFAIILAATWLVAKLVSIVIGRVMRNNTPLVAAQTKRTGWLIVWAIGAILAIEQLPINSVILLIVVALLGAAVVVALRVPLENIGARYFSDVYVPFKIGDSVKVQNYAGKVVEINSMSTLLLTETDELVSIPNSLLVREVVVNATPQAWKEVTIPIAIGSGIDLASFENALLKSINKLKLHLDKRFPPLLSTKARGTQSTDLVLTVMIERPEQRDQITTEINKRVAEIMETSKTK